MRNLKRALSLALASVMLMGMMVVGSSAASYPDVDSNDNTEAIAVLNAVEVMIGNENGEFEPDKNVTRNEMAVILAKLILGKDADKYVGTCPFTDVPDWAQKYVAACYDNKIVAGRTESLYDGNATVTAQEAAAMVLRVLGYEKLESTGTNWAQPVVAKANELRLFADVGSSASAPLNRNQVAQLSLNALETTMVISDVEKDIIIDGVATIPGKVTYDDRYSKEDWNNAIAGGTAGEKGLTLQLGEYLYEGDLKKDTATADNDGFGRPGDYQWTWKNTTEVYNVVKSSSVTFTKDTSEDDVLKAIRNYVFGGTAETGVKVTSKTSAVDTTQASAIEGDISFSNGDSVVEKIADATKNGKSVEIFATDKVVDKIVVITYKVSEVESITTNNDGDVTYKLKNVGSKKIYADPDKQDDNQVVLYGDVAEDDVVTVALDNDNVAHVYPTTSFTGTQESYSAADGTITVDGKKYDVALGVTGVALTGEKDKFPNSEDEATFYVDQFGFVVKSDAAETASEYAIIDKIALVEGRGTKGDQLVEADLIFTDGTSATVNVSKINGIDVTDATKVKGGVNVNEVKAYVDDGALKGLSLSTKPSENSKLSGAIVDYTQDGDDYELTLRGALTAAESTSEEHKALTVSGIATVDRNNSVVTNGKPNVAGISVNGRDDTMYVVKTGDNEFKPYTGFDQVPSIKVNNESGDKAVVSYTTDGGKVVLIYIDATKATVGNETAGRVLYVSDTKLTTVGSGKNAYYTITGIVDGEEKVTIKTEKKDRFEDLNKGDLFELTENEDGYVTKMTSLDDSSKFEKSTLAKDAGGKTMGKWTYNDDTQFTAIGTDHKVVGNSADEAKKGDTVYVKVVGTKSGSDANDILAEIVYIVKREAEGEVAVGTPDANEVKEALKDNGTMDIIPDDNGAAKVPDNIDEIPAGSTLNVKAGEDENGDAVPAVVPSETPVKGTLNVDGDAKVGDNGEGTLKVTGEGGKANITGGVAGGVTAEGGAQVTVGAGVSGAVSAEGEGTKVTITVGEDGEAPKSITVGKDATVVINGDVKAEDLNATGEGVLIINGNVNKPAKEEEPVALNLSEEDAAAVAAMTAGIGYYPETACTANQSASTKAQETTAMPKIKGDGQIWSFSSVLSINDMLERHGNSETLSFYVVTLSSASAGTLTGKWYVGDNESASAVFTNDPQEIETGNQTMLLAVGSKITKVVYTVTPAEKAGEAQTYTIYFNGNEATADKGQ